MALCVTDSLIDNEISFETEVIFRFCESNSIIAIIASNEVGSNNAFVSSVHDYIDHLDKNGLDFQKFTVIDHKA